MEKIPHFTKHYMTEADLVALLKSRGLIISDEAKAVGIWRALGTIVFLLICTHS